jgi:large conductance mechanosensitive channel
MPRLGYPVRAAGGGEKEGAVLKEFREFALKGNAVDLAIGVVVGAAFGAIVNSLVNDIIMPPFGKLIGGADFTDLFVVLGHGSYPTLAAAKEAGATTLNYGAFVNTLVRFMIIAGALFFVVRGMNALKRAEPAPAPATKDCPQCATAIPVKAVRCPHCTSTL